MPAPQDDWSDSDDDLLSDTETSVQLGLPDGHIESDSDIFDAAVSRIGGHPAFLTQEPPLDSAQCKNCKNQMELLVQLWCPLEDSPNDRALYIWGCPRTPCQKKLGSVRAWRGLKLNDKYAAKLEKKRLRQKQLEEQKAKALATEMARAAASKVNPFSMKSPAPNPFGLGSQVFGSATPTEQSLSQDQTHSPDDNSEDEDDSEDEGELVIALASTTLEDSQWKTAPSYPPIYLSTTGEYLPPAPKSKLKVSSEAVILEEAAEGKNKGGEWGMEGYENSMDLDHVFERFTARVEHQGEQCIRYELGGVPLPFAGDAIFDQLFPVPSSPYVSATRPGYSAPPAKRTYDPSSLPVCPVCKSKRVFECQLMPNLINVLETSTEDKNTKKAQTDEERRKEIEHALKGHGSLDGRGMQWGTCMIFSCEKDCCLDGKLAAKTGWREEVVLVQWDT
ncbi:programmed cell death protein 2 [Cristinia sonorae]|uniref:Programmed cell death protein 2 n=1 Tax=Cristinia sonorae TaxID=1940300 RepID=A0A8K0XMH7_9AGAR|nr:programmed cell death protein 2 [Cristinia sonorae]